MCTQRAHDRKRGSTSGGPPLTSPRFRRDAWFGPEPGTPEGATNPSLGAFMRLSKMLPAFTAATAITAGVLAAPRVLTDLHWRLHSAARADSDA